MLDVLVREWPANLRVHAQFHERCTYNQCAAVRSPVGFPCPARNVLLEPLDQCSANDGTQGAQYLGGERWIVGSHKCTEEVARPQAGDLPNMGFEST